MDENKKTVLIVEDNEALVNSYAEALDAGGYNAMKVLDGYQALDLLSKSSDAIKLILLDLMMPGVDGLEVLRTVKDDAERYGEAPIIILTNMTSENVIKDAFALGATSYLVKTDLDYQGLIKEVNKFLG